MRIDCSCGATIKDVTDNLPHKGHMIPDQEWFAVFEAIDAQVIDALYEGRIDRDRAYTLARRLISRSAELMYQCRDCGRLYVDRRERLECFIPETDQTHCEVLRSRSDGDSPGAATK